MECLPELGVGSWSCVSCVHLLALTVVLFYKFLKLPQMQFSIPTKNHKFYLLLQFSGGQGQVFHDRSRICSDLSPFILNWTANQWQSGQQMSGFRHTFLIDGTGGHGAINIYIHILFAYHCIVGININGQVILSS